MVMRQTRADEISSGVFLIGLGLCFYFGFWPTIMFVIGASSIIQGLVQGRGWYAFQGATWTIGIGIWALMGFSLAGLFVMIGLSVIVAALVRPPFLQPKPKPFVDNTLE
jgi:hypothetical protein